MKEIKRIVATEIATLLKQVGAILIEGPKLCGKTFMGQKFSQSQFYVQDYQDLVASYLLQPVEQNIIFTGAKPRLIDEWQLAPAIWDKARLAIDLSQNKNGLFILTGSSRAKEGSRLHGGAGRIYRLEMTTLTFNEILTYQGQQTFISLKSLFAKEPININNYNHYNLDWVVKQVIQGGWPLIESHHNPASIAPKTIKTYIDSIVTINDLVDQNLRLESQIALKILKSLARLNGCQLNQNTVLADINNGISKTTLIKYLDYFANLFLIFNLPVWRSEKCFVSKTRMRTKNKFYFCDPSIAAYLLGIKTKENFYQDWTSFGQFFENQVIKDLLTYTQALGMKLYFYRDANGLEIDAIIETDDNHWAAIEIKVGSAPTIEQAAKTLKHFAQKMINNDLKEPQFLMIITAGGYSLHPYCRPDGVYVVPHPCLGI